MQDDSRLTLNQRLIRIGVGESHASMLATGKRTPSLDLALEIEAKLGIAPSFWRDRPDLKADPIPEGTAS